MAIEHFEVGCAHVHRPWLEFPVSTALGLHVLQLLAFLCQQEVVVVVHVFFLDGQRVFELQICLVLLVYLRCLTWDLLLILALHKEGVAKVPLGLSSFLCVELLLRK